MEIKLLLSDCDGCLTDGGMYYSENGDELKKFNTRDGVAFSLLHQKGILTGIVTGESVELVKKRADKLSLDYIELGCENKLETIKNICNELNISLGQVAYIGDDINDFEVIKNVGFGCVPSDASKAIKDIADYVCEAKGGDGVVREVVDKFFLNDKTDPVSRNKKNISKILTWISMLISTVIILPILYYSMLSIPRSDDFSQAMRAKSIFAEGNSYFKAGVLTAIDYYKTWQGTYLGCFCQGFFAPFFRGGIKGVRCFNTATDIAFFLSLFFLVYACIRGLKVKNVLTVTSEVFCIMLFFTTNNWINSEIYTWSAGMIQYIIPITVLFFGIGFYILAIGIDSSVLKNLFLILASLLGLIGAGGKLNISVLGCEIYFIMLLIAICHKPKAKHVFIPFVFMLMGTIINGLAPGNFSRYNVNEKEYGVLSAFISAFVSALDRLRYLSFHTPFLFLLFVLVWILWFNIEEISIDNKAFFRPVLLGGFFLLGIVLVNIPYTFGNKRGYLQLVNEDRALFVEDVSIYLLMGLWLVYLIGYIKNKHIVVWSNKRRITEIVIAMGLNLLVIIGYTDSLYDMTTPYMLMTIADGSAHRCSDYWESILYMIEHNDGDEFVLYYDGSIANNSLLPGVGLDNDTDDWVNKVVAKWYGKKTISVY